MASPTPPSTPADVQRREFGTMGTFGELLLRADAATAQAAFDDVVRDIELVAAACTRFDPTSPIERLNDAGGGRVEGVLHEVLAVSLKAFADTGGLVDVGLGGELIAAGYDRDFDLLDAASAADVAAHAGRAAAEEEPAPAPAIERPAPFALEPDGEVALRRGARIDLGGIAKGWAADRACAALAAHGSCLVNLGGDVAVHVAPGDEPWPIGLELGGGGIGTWDLAQGGVATSGQDRRVWRTGRGGGGGDAGLAHHLVDPRTGRPSTSDVLRISVFGATCVDAEVWSKALLLMGADVAQATAAQFTIPAIIVGTDGATRFVGVAPPPDQLAGA